MARLRDSWPTSLPAAQQPRNPQSESIARSPYYFLAPSIIEGTQADHIHLYWMEEAVRLRVDRSPIRRGEVSVPMLEIHLG